MLLKQVSILVLSFLMVIVLSQAAFAASAVIPAHMSSDESPRQPQMPYFPTDWTGKTKSLPRLYGNLHDWFTFVNCRFLKGTKYRVIDFDTSLYYDVIRVGGSKHADVEPATTADTQAMYKTLGNTWDNWRRRALIVIINGEPHAASLYGEPHGYDTIKNNGMTGQVCIHFLNSKTHGTNRVDPDHQYQIKRAAGLVK